MTTTARLFLALLFLGLMVGGLSAQVTLERNAFVYHGSAANATAPATIDDDKVRAATVEWQTIRSEGIDERSARGRQLAAKMNKRIRAAVRAVASSQGRDLVVREQDIADDQGREVVDLTDAVVREIEASCPGHGRGAAAQRARRTVSTILRSDSRSRSTSSSTRICGSG
jgi:hypothetical protein